MLHFSLIQAGLIEITAAEGVKDSRPTSSLLRHNDFKMVIDTEHPKEDGAGYAAAFERLGWAPQEIGRHFYPPASGSFRPQRPVSTRDVFVS